MVMIAIQAQELHSHMSEYPIKLDEEQLKKTLDPLSYSVLREAATERPFTGEYTDSETIGIYKCKACNAELFKIGRAHV
mgnify:FL=1